MKRSRLILVCFMGLCIAQQAHCALMVNDDVSGEKITLDTETGKYWYWNLLDFTNMDYDEQIAKIAELNLPGTTYGNIVGGWAMATEAEITALFDNYDDPQDALDDTFLGDYFGPTSAVSDAWYFDGRWEGAYTESGVDKHYRAWMHYNPITKTLNDGAAQAGGYPDTDSLGTLGAWVVTDQSVVPVPPTVLLGILGMGVAGLKLRKFA